MKKETKQQISQLIDITNKNFGKRVIGRYIDKYSNNSDRIYINGTHRRSVPITGTIYFRSFMEDLKKIFDAKLKHNIRGRWLGNDIYSIHLDDGNTTIDIAIDDMFNEWTQIYLCSDNDDIVSYFNNKLASTYEPYDFLSDDPKEDKKDEKETEMSNQQKPKTELKDRWREICDEYVTEFCKKHNYYKSTERDTSIFWRWVENNPGTVVNMGDKYIDMGTIRYDIDNEIPVGGFERWHSKYTELHKLGVERWMSYENYCAGVVDLFTGDRMERLRTLKGRLDKDREHLDDLLKMGEGITIFKLNEIHRLQWLVDNSKKELEEEIEALTMEEEEAIYERNEE